MCIIYLHRGQKRNLRGNQNVNPLYIPASIAQNQPFPHQRHH